LRSSLFTEFQSEYTAVMQ